MANFGTSFFGENPFIATSSVGSVVGTWTAVGQTFVGNTRETETAVIQFRADGTFSEGINVGGNLAAYFGTYSFNSSTDRISYTIVAASPSTGPQLNPFDQLAESSPVVSLNGHIGVELNNNLFFQFQSSSVAASDFVLPAAPATPASFFDGTPFLSGANPNMSASNGGFFQAFPHF